MRRNFITILKINVLGSDAGGYSLRHSVGQIVSQIIGLRHRMQEEIFYRREVYRETNTCNPIL